MKLQNLIHILIAIVCIGLLPQTQAVVPPPGDFYPGGNTASGQNALLSLTSGTYNTAVGFSSLKSNTSGNVNTAIGVNALSFNITGNNNSANGVNALYHNTTGDGNTANGEYALFSNTTGDGNTASGGYALWGNTTGGGNTAIGADALFLNTTGSSNTAVGAGALHLGGDSNTALGVNAGYDINGSNNIDIGANVLGFPGESNTIRIGNTNITDTFISGISGTTVASGAAVVVDSSGHLGTVTSSKRFKEEIRPMNNTSEAIFSLEPVTFRYKKQIDPAGTSQFGLIAEEVAKVNPTLVLPDKEGKLYTVRYDVVNAMLLNEFLKEHRKVQEQEATIAGLKSEVTKQASAIAHQQNDFEATMSELRKEMETVAARFKEQDAKIQRVSDQIEVKKTATQIAVSNR